LLPGPVRDVASRSERSSVSTALRWPFRATFVVPSRELKAVQVG
jgi:hypothetical protein